MKPVSGDVGAKEGRSAGCVAAESKSGLTARLVFQDFMNGISVTNTRRDISNRAFL